MRRAILAAFLAAACAPGVQPLKGVPAPALSLPPLQLAPAHRKIVFRWEYTDGESLTRGDGAVRLAAPDSARVDFFLGAYVIGGAGYYHESLSGTALNGDAQNHFGFNIGGGLNIPLTGFDAFIEARYHRISEDGGSTSFVPVTVGILF